jgi:Fe-S cluster assembly protein SufB
MQLDEQKALSGVAVAAVMDSVSVKATFKKALAERGEVNSCLLKHG